MLLDALTGEKMMEALEGIDDTIKRHNVRFVRLQFSDIVGIVKQVTIPIEHWDRAVENGVWFDGSSIEGFARIAESDMYLVPDLQTFMPIPWEMELSTARVVCDVYTPNGDHFVGDPASFCAGSSSGPKRWGTTLSSARNWSFSSSAATRTTASTP